MKIYWFFNVVHPPIYIIFHISIYLLAELHKKKSAHEFNLFSVFGFWASLERSFDEIKNSKSKII